jgi:hypothetical protein
MVVVTSLVGGRQVEAALINGIADGCFTYIPTSIVSVNIMVFRRLYQSIRSFVLNLLVNTVGRFLIPRCVATARVCFARSNGIFRFLARVSGLKAALLPDRCQCVMRKETNTYS